jgi:hypothetical protein
VAQDARGVCRGRARWVLPRTRDDYARDPPGGFISRAAPSRDKPCEKNLWKCGGLILPRVLTREERDAKAAARRLDQERRASAARDRRCFDEKGKAFLLNLSKGWSLTRAAREADLDRRTAMQRREGSDKFRLAWDMALDCGTDRLEDAMFHRAVVGIDEPIMHQGKIVATKKVYASREAEVLLRGRRPEKYGHKQVVSHQHVVSGEVVVSAVRAKLLDRLGRLSPALDASVGSDGVARISGGGGE